MIAPWLEPAAPTQLANPVAQLNGVGGGVGGVGTAGWPVERQADLPQVYPSIESATQQLYPVEAELAVGLLSAALHA